jgi:hypothetical protein
MEDIEDRLDDEDLVDEGADEEPEDVEVAEEPAPLAREPEEGDVESIQELLVKQEAKAAEEEEEDALLALSREERLEPLAVKVVPPQPHEFVCQKCYLVKHRSQLKDKTRMLCRDCA